MRYLYDFEKQKFYDTKKKKYVTLDEMSDKYKIPSLIEKDFKFDEAGITFKDIRKVRIYFIDKLKKFKDIKGVDKLKYVISSGSCWTNIAYSVINDISPADRKKIFNDPIWTARDIKIIRRVGVTW